MSEKSFYQKVSDLDFKELVSFIDHNKTEFVIKFNGQYVKANVNHIKNNKAFSIFKFNSYDFTNEHVTCCFFLRDEIYFFYSLMSSNNIEYTIDLPPEIYQLQRRNDFRVSMPIGMPQTCIITYLKQVKKHIVIGVRDLSLGGCQLSAPAAKLEINTDDEFTMTLKIDRFEFTNLQLKARHCKLIKEQNNLLIGASFLNLDGENLSEMLALLMFLDRKARGKESD